jgi:hypothetical protein
MRTSLAAGCLSIVSLVLAGGPAAADEPATSPLAITGADVASFSCPVSPPPPPAWHFVPDAAVSGTFYPDHTYRSGALGTAVSLDVSHDSGVFFGATYRYTRFFTRDKTLFPEWGQHEIYASGGYATALFGLQFTYAMAHDESGTVGTSHHFGLSGRWSPLGDIVLDAAASLYDTMTVFRLAPSWRIPIYGGLSIRPGAALQAAGGAALGSVNATLSLDREIGSLYFGGKYGDEVRPAYLSLAVIDNLVERIRWGLWAGGSLNVGKKMRIDLAYSTDRLQEPNGREDNGHTVTLGASGRF